ncbi:MAG: 4Fe-4S dicluster domain-containing protein [Erysipelotrichaceae bacterium]
MRQKTRRLIVYLSLLLFPVTLNFFSPYVSIDGALTGIISGSVLVFLIMFLSGLFFGRAWCAWVCPMAGLSDMTKNINDKPVNVKRLTIIRYSIFFVWFSLLITCFVLAGGIKGVNPLHLTESIISVDQPVKYITYYLVLFIFGGLSVWLGRRAACHSICWMSPFLVGGYLLGRTLRFPQLRVKTEASKCIDCKQCNKKCPMSINVNDQVKKGEIVSLDCILCGECVDTCPKKVLRFGIRTR